MSREQGLSKEGTMTLSRFTLASATLPLAILLWNTPARAQDSHYAPRDGFLRSQQFSAPDCLIEKGAWEGGSRPCTAKDFQQWLDDLIHWRAERKIRVGYSEQRYARPEFKWTQSGFIQPQMMVQDRYFYDPVAGKYTVDRYLDDLDKRFGGIDAVLIWPTYPNMGIDDRNQHDMIRSMPGGVPAVRKMVDDFHHRGVHVLFPMMMWDQGTHDPGMPWPQAIAETMKEVGADGINGDTQDGVPLAYSLAADAIGHPLVFEPEGSPSDEALAWNVLTWGQYKFDFVPLVDKYRWLEPLHQVNISDRWNRDKTDDLQFAFFNGEGWESWENIWGIWNGITPRDSEATRRVATIERAVAPFFSSKEWRPLYPTHRYGVFASQWPQGQQTVWTIVNRNEYDVAGRQISVLYTAGTRYYDLYHGTELTPEHDGDQAVLIFPIEAHGYAALLATSGEPGHEFVHLMDKMKQMTGKPLASYSHEWKPLPQQLVEIAKTKPASSAPDGMIMIPAADYVFKVEGIEVEGSNNAGVDLQYPWEDIPRRYHEHKIHISTFYMDKYPVTNADFKKFVDAAHYHPADDLNFLKDWKDGSYPEGWADKPVTWVSLEDARAYAKWSGKRLPHEWEWQYAAQGSDSRIYPWGDVWDVSRVPAVDHGRSMHGPDSVSTHPTGASPSGIMDLVGNVWQWTDEYVDDHTRGGILRGGSYYQPVGSIWYFPQAYRNNQHGKLLLMAPSYDRSGAVGFRCVKDTE
jgi:gamma-glutamyl hercynylcysteine S-oxide synthase